MTWQFNRIPQIRFGVGVRYQLIDLIREFGERVLLVTGNNSFSRQSDAKDLLAQWVSSGCQLWHETIADEPSPEWVDGCVSRYIDHGIEVVVAIGGGSALDAAKAVAGLLAVKSSVMNFLEGVGPEYPYEGNAFPFIAMPTTAGTGAEATKNAVLSQRGVTGFKKSFRHDSLMPRYAVIDPEWMLSLHPSQIAANGLDAITQLIEGYTSTKASPMTDALALAGLEKGLKALPRWFQLPNDVDAASDMAFAALMSGMVLAQAGLGAVHGMASPLGAFFPAPHGAVCGVLLAETTAANISALQVSEPSSQALLRYARIGNMLSERSDLSLSEALKALVDRLRQWQNDFQLPSLTDFGMTQADIDRVVASSRGNSMKTNPIVLSDHQLTQILEACL